MIDHVVFDIGRVLIHWDPGLPYRRLIEDERERAEFLADVCSPAWNYEQDRGRSWADAEAALIDRHPDKAALIRAFRLTWREMVPHAYDDSVAILRHLIAQGVDVTMLTNFAADTFLEAEALYPFLRESRGVTVSGTIGLVKPDAAIFEHHARAFALVPARTLFIDDVEANVEGARAAGWNAILFTDGKALGEALRDHGLPVETAAMTTEPMR